MNNTFETTWPFFLIMLAGYIVLSLALGGKGVYFEPYKGQEEEKKAGG